MVNRNEAAVWKPQSEIQTETKGEVQYAKTHNLGLDPADAFKLHKQIP